MGWISWLCPGINLKRWLLLFAGGVLCCAIGLALFFNYQFMGFVEEMLFRMSYLTTGKYSNTVSMLTGFISLCAGLFIMYYATRKIIRSVVEAVMPDNNASLMEIIFTQRKLTRGPAITVVGGGTGLSTLLRGMKYITNNCTAVVTVGDDGYREGTNQVIIRSTAVVMTRCEIYTVNGQLIDSVSYPADEYQLRLSPGINLIKVYIQDETPQILKLSNY